MSLPQLTNFTDLNTFRPKIFVNINKVLNELGVSNLSGVLFDLGVSSYKDSELDMRMSKEGISAKDFINTAA